MTETNIVADNLSRTYRKTLSALADLGDAASNYREHFGVSQKECDAMFETLGLDNVIVRIGRTAAKQRQAAKFFSGGDDGKPAGPNADPDPS